MSEILINKRPNELRVAFVEGGLLRDLKIERTTSPTLVGSIHRGKVKRVLPGMQAAFVDIGLDRAAFLYVGDVKPETQDLPEILDIEDSTEDEELKEEEDALTLGAKLGNSSLVGANSSATSGGEILGARKPPTQPIQELIKEGQSLLVQVAKDPLGTKGARITMNISLPGRHVVYMPTFKHFGISRRIEDLDERERLLKIIKSFDSPGGIIVRTVGEGVAEEKLKSDLEYLQRLWKDTLSSYEKRKTPGALHKEMDAALRATRDLLDENVTRVIVDDVKEHKNVLKFVGQFMPKFKNRIELYKDRKPLFDMYDIDYEISRSMDRKVWLKSGGYLVIDEAEALVVIDINTGSYVGKKDFEDTIFKTNLEAVKEVAHQLRVRNCGGIIIIDFIDMEKEAHRDTILEQLKVELESDKARTNVLAISELGLIEMTRKRIRPSLVKILCRTCSYCDGKGYIKRDSTVAYEIFREIEREGKNLARGQSIIVSCHSRIADWVYEEESVMLEFMEKKYQSSIVFKVKSEFHTEQYEVTRLTSL